MEAMIDPRTGEPSWRASPSVSEAETRQEKFLDGKSSVHLPDLEKNVQDRFFSAVTEIKLKSAYQF
jgi:hypothetical protein